MVLTDKQRQTFANIATALKDCMYVLECEYDIRNPYFPKENCKDSNLLSESKDRANIIYQDFEYDFAWCNELEQIIDGKEATEIESFIFDILAYFKDFSDVYYPYARIEDCKKIIHELEMQIERKPQNRKDCEGYIKKQNETIELLQVRAEKYESITCNRCGVFGEMFVVLLSWVGNFSNFLDSILMKRGIDLMELQKESGIYIKAKESSIDMRAMDVSLFVGSFEIAKKYMEKIMPIVSEFNENSERIKKQGAKSPSFVDVIQYKDKEKLLEKLHQLIDGKKGADVGAVLLKARLDNYITRNPTRKEFENEFELIGSWSAISNYMNDNNENALDRANRIVIFS